MYIVSALYIAYDTRVHFKYQLALSFVNIARDLEHVEEA